MQSDGPTPAADGSPAPDGSPALDGSPGRDGSPVRVVASGLGRAVGCLATLAVLGLIVAGALKLLLALLSG